LPSFFQIHQQHLHEWSIRTQLPHGGCSSDDSSIVENYDWTTHLFNADPLSDLDTCTKSCCKRLTQPESLQCSGRGPPDASLQMQTLVLISVFHGGLLMQFPLN
jgi:hypothetical protein